MIDHAFMANTLLFYCMHCSIIASYNRPERLGMVQTSDCISLRMIDSFNLASNQILNVASLHLSRTGSKLSLPLLDRMSLKPLIAVVGTTGVGKSRLAVDLALHCAHLLYPKARVINSDAMQVYSGLNILTNKMPSEERRGVKHCLMDFRAPGEQYLVTDWVKDASTCIEEAHREGELPIVVGGTSYWIQNLIFASRLASLPPESEIGKDYDPELLKRLASLPAELRDIWLNLPSKAPHPDDSPEEAYRLHSLLSALDSTTASRWHWRDSRRVLTSLRVIKEQKRTVGSVHAEQFPQARSRSCATLTDLLVDF
jgi:tRNA dimethylallyltransferase